MPVVPDSDFDESIADRERELVPDAGGSGGLNDMLMGFLKPPDPTSAPGAAAGGAGAVTGAVAEMMSAGDLIASKIDEGMMALLGVGSASGTSDDSDTSDDSGNSNESGDPGDGGTPKLRRVDERTAAARKEFDDRPPLTVGQKIKRFVIGSSVVGVLVILYVAATMYQVWSLSSVDDAVVGSGPYDAIVVLGAAQYNGEPSPVLAARLDRAHQLYDDGFSDIIITTGSKQAGDTYTEGYAGYEYLRGEGVPDEAIRVIVDGSNTWEELSASAAVMQDEDRRSVLMVSDPYHNYRMARIADEVGLEAYVAPTDTQSTFADYARETVANSIGQITGFRRLSNWSENS